ncbi:MAG: hypothetical protein ABSG00_08390 [Terracidiphilus sp.]
MGRRIADPRALKTLGLLVTHEAGKGAKQYLSARYLDTPSVRQRFDSAPSPPAERV